MIIVKEVTNKTDLLSFIKFPFELYKDNHYWVPPIINDELETFNPNNPIYETVESKLFLAYQNNKIVGRIAGIINKVEINQQNKLKVRFGWFDFIDNLNVSKALIDKVIDYGKHHNLTYIEGPVGFTNMDKAGMLTFGFNELATMIGLYNYEYYPNHLEKLGFIKEAEWIEYKFNAQDTDVSNAIKLADVVEKRYDVSSLNFKTSKEVIPYADQMFGLLNATYKDLQSFVPIQEFQIEHYKRKYLPLVNPKFISCVVDNKTKDLVAFAVTIPSLSKGFQKANGKLFPFGFLHLIKSLKFSKNVEFYLIGIHPDYQNKGVTALIFRELNNIYKKHKIQWIETNPQLEENKKVLALWKNFNPTIHKKRKTFRKDF